MRILVLAADYPRTDGSVALYYIHTRNLYYKSCGADVRVLNFASAEDYVIQDIPVYTLKTYDSMRNEPFDILLSHAPNIRNHYRFLRKYGDLFSKIVFFFHGHEVLRCSRVYPKPYDYCPQAKWLSRVGRELYDTVKLRIWRTTFNRLAHKSWFVFVSEWMYQEFLRWVRPNACLIEDRMSIIYNSIGSEFEKSSFNWDCAKDFDFVTIRNNLDSSKYCIDVVTHLAATNKQYRFCVVGRGDYFRFHRKPDNLTLVERYLNHKQICELLNKSKCALLPTRADAQGVMACEIASFGMPLITSDLPICREVFAGFGNVAFISNEESSRNLAPILESLISAGPQPRNRRFFAENTVAKEFSLIKTLIEGDKD